MTTSLRAVLAFTALSGLAVYGYSSVADADSQSSQLRALSEESSASPQPADAPPHKPPQAAFDACKNASEGAACSVTFHDHTMTGTCKKGPNGEDALACAPDHPPGPPQEAIDACKSASEGASCSVTFHGQTLSGTCSKGPDGSGVLACMPAHPPGPPPDGSHESIGSSALEHELDQLEKNISGHTP